MVQVPTRMLQEFVKVTPSSLLSLLALPLLSFPPFLLVLLLSSLPFLLVMFHKCFQQLNQSLSLHLLTKRFSVLVSVMEPVLFLAEPLV